MPEHYYIDIVVLEYQYFGMICRSTTTPKLLWRNHAEVLLLWHGRAGEAVLWHDMPEYYYSDATTPFGVNDCLGL